MKSINVGMESQNSEWAIVGLETRPTKNQCMARVSYRGYEKSIRSPGF